jgi:hypothetical protein
VEPAFTSLISSAFLLDKGASSLITYLILLFASIDLSYCSIIRDVCMLMIAVLNTTVNHAYKQCFKEGGGSQYACHSQIVTICLT